MYIFWKMREVFVFCVFKYVCSSVGASGFLIWLLKCVSARGRWKAGLCAAGSVCACAYGCVCVCVCVYKAADGTCHYQSHKSLAPGVLTLCPRGKEPAEVEESSGFPRLKLARLGPASAFLGCQHSVNVWTALNK